MHCRSWYTKRMGERKIGLKFKLGKYRSTAESGGCTEVAEKTYKDVTDLEPLLSALAWLWSVLHSLLKERVNKS